jgi:membrane fusion protein, multidrug efflux system
MNTFKHISGCIKITFLVLPLTLLFMTTSCRQKGDSGQRQASPVKVEGYIVEPEFYTVSIRTTGELLSYEEVELKTPVAGNVLNIYFQEGQYVNRGDLLVEIDNRSWAARKTGLEAQLSSAQSELSRKKELLKIEGVSQEEMEQSQAEESNLKAQIEELDVMIDLAHIRAPFSGWLGMRNFSPGAFLTQGETITRLVQNDKIKVNFSIPSRYAVRAEKDQEVTIFSSATGDTAIATIYAVDPIITPSSRTLNVRALLENKNNDFLPGDFAQIIFEVEQYEDALLVPAESVIPEMNSQVVYLANNGKAVRQEVETGSRTHNRVQILKGLAPGDTVLTTGLMTVQDGDPVEISTTKTKEPK